VTSSDANLSSAPDSGSWVDRDLLILPAPLARAVDWRVVDLTGAQRPGGWSG